MNQPPRPATSEWSALYRAGGVAALLAGLLFRRNLAVEVSLFSPQAPPAGAADAFALLQAQPLLGLTYLHIFDVANYALLAVVLLALYVLLRRASQSAMAVATALGLLGIVVYLASNTALSMYALSERYAGAGEAERAALLAAGQTLMAFNHFGASGAHPGSAGYLSLLLVAVAGMAISLVMRRSGIFHRATAYVGILASACDLAYCVAYALVPADGHLLAVLFIPAGGLFLMVWHILIGVKLYRLGRPARKGILQPTAAR